MKTHALLLLFLGITVRLMAQVPDYTWQQCHGSRNTDMEINAIVETKEGYLMSFLVKEPDTMISNFHGGSDAWLVWTDKAGNIIHENCYGFINWEKVVKIIPVKDQGYYLFGYTTSSQLGNPGLWVVRIDLEGNILWEKSFGNLTATPTDAVLTPTNGLLMMGSSFYQGGDVSVVYGGNDLWFCQVDAYGNFEWEKTIGYIRQENALDMKLTDHYTVMVAGTFATGGGLITCEDLDGIGGGDVWLFELDFGGNILQQFSFGGSDWEQATNLMVLDDGYIIAAASYSDDGDLSMNHGDEDIWVFKCDFLGKIIWEKSFGGSGYDYAIHLSATIDGGFVIIGYTGSNDGDVSNPITPWGGDIWMIKLDSNGVLEWEQCYGIESTSLEEVKPSSIVKVSDDQYVIGVSRVEYYATGDKTCASQPPAPYQNTWNTWIFGLKDCSQYPVPFAAPPSGPDSLCSTTEQETIYSITPDADLWGYSWTLNPGEAGTLISHSDWAAIRWSPGWQGEATIGASGYNECGSSDSATTMITNVWSCVGVEEVNADSPLRVYPNPSNDLLHLSSEQADTGQFGLYTLQGKQVRSVTIISKQTTLSVAGLPPGLYLWKVVQGHTVSSGKVVVE